MAKAKGLWANINARKKAGTSRSKKDSTITKKAYANMKKVSKALVKASKLHAGQAKVLKKIIKKKA